ncbi:MAG: OmpH family outer membrane protein [Alphaproteobacteria bacterium]
MKQALNRIMFSLAAVMFLGFAMPASADTSIGVVNLQKIMRDSKAATAVRSQLQAKQKAFQADLDAKEKDLYAQEQPSPRKSRPRPTRPPSRRK